MLDSNGFDIVLLQLQALTAVHVGFGLTGLILLLLFVDKQKTKGKFSFREEFLRIIGATVRQMKRKRQLLLTPLNIYTGLTQSFILADITKVSFNMYVL